MVVASLNMKYNPWPRLHPSRWCDCSDCIAEHTQKIRELRHKLKCPNSVSQVTLSPEQATLALSLMGHQDTGAFDFHPNYLEISHGKYQLSINRYSGRVRLFERKSPGLSMLVEKTNIDTGPNHIMVDHAAEWADKITGARSPLNSPED